MGHTQTESTRSPTANQPASESSESSSATAIPPRWALGYHESYKDLPTPESLVTVGRRFRQEDTPLESLQITPASIERAEMNASAGKLPDAVANRLHELGIKTARFVEQRSTEPAPGCIVSNEKANSRSSTADAAHTCRPFFLTSAAAPGTPPETAVSFPVELSDWKDLREAAVRCFELAGRGLPLCGPDLHVPDQPTDSELLIRSIQLAVFLPLLRATFPRPTLAPDAVWPFDRSVTRIWRRYLGLRYKLLPYLYTAFDQFRRSGAPPLREITQEEAEGEESDLPVQFHLGSSLMVAPVLDSSRGDRPTYLPEDVWFHFWTNQPEEGPRTLIQSAPVERIPVFARGGSVVPLYPYMSRTDGSHPATLMLRTYPRGTRSNDVYVDDGCTDAFLDGDFRRLTINTSQEPEQFTVTIEHEGDRPLPYDHFEWQLPLQSARTAVIDGRNLPFFDVPEQFVAADEGIFTGHFFIRVRTPAAVRRLTISTK